MNPKDRRGSTASLPFVSIAAIVAALFAGVAFTVAPRALTNADIAPLKVFAASCPSCHNTVVPANPVALNTMNPGDDREQVLGTRIRDSGDESEREDRD